jgi:hypothetical protein
MTTATMTHETTLTIADLKKHRGLIMAWVKVFDGGGEYVLISKTAILKAIGADIPYSRDGLDPGTALKSSSKILDGIFYIG